MLPIAPPKDCVGGLSLCDENELAALLEVYDLGPLVP